jgi:hypothetical protein
MHTLQALRGTRLALQLLLVKGFKLYSLQDPAWSLARVSVDTEDNGDLLL